MKIDNIPEGRIIWEDGGLESRIRALESLAPTATMNQTINYIGGGAEPDGNQRSATVVVAAADSSPDGKAGADYVCAGSSDEDTINEAILGLAREEVTSGTAAAATSTSITLANTASNVWQRYLRYYVRITGGTGAGQERLITAYSPGGNRVATVAAWDVVPDTTSTYVVERAVGRVLLLEGTYNIDGAILLNDYVILEGQGQSSVVKLQSSATGTIYSITTVIIGGYGSGGERYGCEVRNLTIDGNYPTTNPTANYGVYLYGCYYARIEGVTARHTKTDAITLYSTYRSRVEGCLVHNVNGHGFRISYSYEAIVTRNIAITLAAGTHAISIVAGARLMVSQNICFPGANAYGINISNLVEDIVVIGNICYSCAVGIATASQFRGVISGNYIYVPDSYTMGAAIYLSPGNYYLVSGNWISTGGSAIKCETTQSAIIANNYLYNCGAAAHNTYHGILIDYNSMYVVAQNNIFRATTSVKLKYCVYISSGSNYSWVTNNDFRGAYQTGTIYDAGTGTITSAGNQS